MLLREAMPDLCWQAARESRNMAECNVQQALINLCASLDVEAAYIMTMP